VIGLMRKPHRRVYGLRVMVISDFGNQILAGKNRVKPNFGWLKSENQATARVLSRPKLILAPDYGPILILATNLAGQQ
jgi:hypothetical protein